MAAQSQEKMIWYSRGGMVTDFAIDGVDMNKIFITHAGKQLLHKNVFIPICFAQIYITWFRRPGIDRINGGEIW